MTCKRSPISEAGCCLAVLVALLGVSLPRGAQAAPASAATSPKNAARKKLMEGADLLKKRDFQGALERFQAAYEILPSPKIQYNLGLAYMGLGRNAEALGAFHTFLSESDDASGDTITNARTYKEALLLKICRLTVSSDVEGASIAVDGRAYGTTPRAEEILLDAGPHALLVEKTGVGKPFSKRFDAGAGSSMTVEAKLLPPKPVRGNRLIMEAPLAGAGDGAPGGGVRKKAGAPAAVVSSSGSGAGSGTRGARWAAWGTGGLAVAALGLGTIEWVIKEQKYGSFNNQSCTTKPEWISMNKPTCAPLLRDGDSAKRLGYIGLGAAAALGVTSAVLFMVSGGARTGTETALACAPSLTEPGATCRLQF